MTTTLNLLSACGLLLASTGAASADGGIRISIGGIGIRVGQPPVVHCAPPPPVCPPVACRPACDESCHVVRYREQTVWETIPRTEVWHDACGRRHEHTIYERVCRTILVPIDPCENPCGHHCDGRCGWGDEHRREHRWGDGERRWGDGERRWVDGERRWSQEGSDAQASGRGNDRRNWDSRRGGEGRRDGDARGNGLDGGRQGTERATRTDTEVRTGSVERTDADASGRVMPRQAGANAPARGATAEAAQAAKTVIRPSAEAMTKAQISARIRGK